MRNSSLADFLLQRIDRGTDAARLHKPMNRQLYQVIRAAILAHLLPVGLQLPSSRELARELALSRNTVMYAYEQLIAEGYLEARAGAGTFIADTAPDEINERAALAAPVDDSGHASLSQRGRQLIAHAGASDVQWGAFLPGVPDVSQFPNKIWSRLQNKVWRRSRVDLLTYGQSGGYRPLRAAIADYLRVARSVNCSAEQVMITTGIHQSIDLAAKLLGDAGERAWVEDPCYWGTRNVLQSMGIEADPVAVDAEGLRFNPNDCGPAPRFIFVTPSHQYPLGAVMSLSRRRLLLEYAAAHQVWIMEDDYDSEFRYGSRPLASLQGMDSGDRVLYLGTFSKTLFPGLRIGFLVVPPALAAPFGAGLSELYRGGQFFTQAVLADFMNEGHYASHIRRMRLLYAERLGLLQQAITRHFGERVTISGGDAGLHLVLGLPQDCDDLAISGNALQQGIITRPLSGYYMHATHAQRGLVLGYACVPSEQIGPLFDTLALIIKAHWPGGYPG